MKAGQISFAAGEITPLLHARVDLARYSTGLAELRNMIVLPQGGVTRRSGFTYCHTITSGEVRHIPFEYNSTDNILIEHARVTTPYAENDLSGLRYVQSGNVMFLVHRKYKPMMLTRKGLFSWVIEEIPYHGGPFIDGAEWNGNAVLDLDGTGDNRTVRSSTGMFSQELVGTLLKLEYAVEAQTETFKSEPEPLTGSSMTYEVKGTLNVMTAGKWTGLITVRRSSDGGASWVTIRQYKRTDIETQGQWDFTVSEAERFHILPYNNFG